MLKRKNKDSGFPSHVVVNGKIISDDQNIANAFNDFFINIGPTLAEAIKKPENKSYTDYIKEKINSKFQFETVNAKKT